MITAALCLGLLAAPPSAAPATAPRPGAVHAAFPPHPDPAARYVIYLHGRIVEDQGRQAVSPELGPYQLDAILEALAGTGATVIGELRQSNADPPAAAAHVVAGIEALIAAGVPAERVTVVGASKGAVIAMLVSTALDRERVGYVLLAGCNQQTAAAFPLRLHGQALSIYEASDPIGRSCDPIFAGSPALGAHAEVKLDTGLAHGFLYRPLPEWIGPAAEWIQGRVLAPAGAEIHPP